MIKIRYGYGLIGLMLSPLAFCAAPIENLLGQGAPAVQQYTDVSTHSTAGSSSPKQSRQMTLLNDVQALQDEVRTLRGTLEMQQHSIKLMQQQQIMLYQELNGRLTQLEGGGKSPPVKAIAVNATDAGQATSSQVMTPNTIGVRVNKPVAVGSVADQEAGKAYQASYQYVLNKQYSEAVQSFQQFLVDHPHTRYEPNVHYWLGQLYLIQGDAALANSQFNAVVTQYPSDPKASEALYKLGYIASLNKDYANAKLIFRQVRERYPDTPASKLATAKLTELAKSGNL